MYEGGYTAKTGGVGYTVKGSGVVSAASFVFTETAVVAYPTSISALWSTRCLYVEYLSLHFPSNCYI